MVTSLLRDDLAKAKGIALKRKQPLICDEIRFAQLQYFKAVSAQAVHTGTNSEGDGACLVPLACHGAAAAPPLRASRQFACGLRHHPSGSSVWRTMRNIGRGQISTQI